jgi:hypothetical protein
MPRPFNRQCDLTLALGTGATNPPGNDPPIVTDELAQKPGIFVVKMVLANTGLTELSSSHHFRITPLQQPVGLRQPSLS